MFDLLYGIWLWCLLTSFASVCGCLWVCWLLLYFSLVGCYWIRLVAVYCVFRFTYNLRFWIGDYFWHWYWCVIGCAELMFAVLPLFECFCYSWDVMVIAFVAEVCGYCWVCCLVVVCGFHSWVIVLDFWCLLCVFGLFMVGAFGFCFWFDYWYLLIALRCLFSAFVFIWMLALL